MVQIPDIINYIENSITAQVRRRYVVVANADSIARGLTDFKMKRAVNDSSLSIPDGFSLMLMGRLHGYPLKKRAYGPDLMYEFLKISNAKQYSHFFYGADVVTLQKLLCNMRKIFPQIRIAGTYAPPFRELTPEEDSCAIQMINQASPDVVWVGIGCPKQEIWMLEHKNKLDVPVMVGVGAAFDYLAQTKPQAPLWMRDYGLEWLFRLFSEPKRLWRRYLINNTIFLCIVCYDFFLSAILGSLRFSRRKLPVRDKNETLK